MTNLAFKLMNLKNAHRKLQEVCDLYDGTNEILRDSTIQRFEFTYELSHKTLLEFILQMGLVPDNKFPRTIYKKAYQNGMIADEQLWLRLMSDRNSTSHIYSERLADDVALRIKTEYVSAIGALIENIERCLEPERTEQL